MPRPICNWSPDATRLPTATTLLGTVLIVAITQFGARAEDAQLDPDVTVFRWTTDRCDDEDIPDVALRVLSLGQGRNEILSSNSNNRFRRFDTTALKAMPNCVGSLSAHRQADPQAYDDYSWIAALSSMDGGRTVHALIHHEFHGNDHAGKCRYTRYAQCWYNTITYARSDDFARTFAQTKPPAVVAAPPFTQDKEQGRRVGFFNPSNIIFYRGYWWTFIYTSGWTGQAFGSCLFRSLDIADPTSWLAYDGKDFTAAFPDPYREEPKASVSCQPLFEQSIGSISQVADGKFVSTYIKRERRKDETGNDFNVVLSWSNDLLHWSEPQPLVRIDDISSTDCSRAARYAFPSLVSIDNGAIGQEQLKGHIFLSMVRFNIHHCEVSLDRDLVFREIKSPLVAPKFNDLK